MSFGRPSLNTLPQDPQDNVSKKIMHRAPHSSHFIDVNTESGACYKLSRAWPTLTSLASQGRKETSESPNTGHLHSALKPGKGLMLWLSPSNAYLVCMELQSRKLKPQYFITQAW